jgi:hypothetical protein
MAKVGGKILGAVGGKVTAKITNSSGRISNFLKNGNNVLRIGNGRLSLGPAPKFFKSGGLTSKIPIHIHLEKSKAGINFLKSGRSIKLWGRWR